MPIKGGYRGGRWGGWFRRSFPRFRLCFRKDLFTGTWYLCRVAASRRGHDVSGPRSGPSPARVAGPCCPRNPHPTPPDSTHPQLTPEENREHTRERHKGPCQKMLTKTSLSVLCVKGVSTAILTTPKHQTMLYMSAQSPSPWTFLTNLRQRIVQNYTKIEPGYAKVFRQTTVQRHIRDCVTISAVPSGRAGSACDLLCWSGALC